MFFFLFFFLGEKAEVTEAVLPFLITWGVWIVQAHGFCEIHLLYSWRFSRFSAAIHWLVHGHLTMKVPWAGNIVKAMTSNWKQFTVPGEIT